MALFEYLKQTQRFLREARQDFLNPEDLISYVNKARREVAMRAQCVRILTPISGQVISTNIIDGGSGYVAPTVTISGPDFPSGTLPFPNGDQATADAQVLGGVITSVDISFGGYGYWQPTITIEDVAGSGAEVTANLSFINQLAAGRELYNFSDVDLSSFPGAAAVYMIKSISIIYSNYRFSLPVHAFSTYQARIRSYTQNFQYVPYYAAQYGQGTSGSFYMYPLPSQPYQMEWDCLCIPQDLLDDQSVEIIPQPWTDAVPYMSAYYGYLEVQNFNMARGYLDLFDKFMQRYSDYARPGRAINPNGLGRF